MRKMGISPTQTRMDEGWLVRELAELGVEDEEVLVPYITGILETAGGTVEQVVECIAVYCSQSTDLRKFQIRLEEKWSAVVEQRELEAKLAATSILPETSAAEPATSPPPKSSSTTIKIDQADKEATLRMARQMVDKERRAFEAAAAPAQEEEEGVNGNRAAVQHKLQQAQKQREEVIKAKQTQSKTAAAEDRKDKEQRKLDRQKRAQKGERRA